MAAHAPENPPKPRRIRRRFLLALFPVLLFAGFWKALESYIDIEHYRPLIDRELELLTELPLTFGAMDLKLFPTPRLVVENVALGEEDFMVFAPEVAVTANLNRLLRKQLELHVVSFEDARVQLPESTPDLKRRWSEYIFALNTPDSTSGKPFLKVTLERITAPGARAFRGDTLYATGDLQVDDVTADRQRFTFSVTGDGIAGQPTARGEFVLDVSGEPLIDGSAAINSLPLAVLTGDTEIPPFLLDGTLTYSQAQDATLRFAATGDVYLRSEDGVLGSVDLAGSHAAGVLDFDQLVVAAQPLVFNGTLRIEPDARWALTAREAAFRDRGIDWLVARLPGIPVIDDPEVRSEGRLADVRMGDDGTGYSFQTGTLTLQGVGLRVYDGFVLPSVEGEVAVEDDTIRITELSSRYLNGTGRVHTDYAAERVMVDFSGQLLFDPEFPLPRRVSETVRLESGRIGIESFHAVLEGGRLLVPELQASAAIEETVAALRSESAQTHTPLPPLSGRASIEGGVLMIAELTGAGGMLSGTLTPDDPFERWAFAGAISSDLTGPIATALLSSMPVRITGGTLECPALNATFVQGGGMPENVEAKATIRNLGVRIDSGGLNEELAFPEITLDVNKDRLSAAGSGTGRRIGPVTGTATLLLNTGDVEGDITLRPAAAALPEAFLKGAGNSIIKRLDPLPLELRYNSASGVLALAAEAPLPLSGTIQFPRTRDANVSIGISATASLPVVWLEPHIADPNAAGNLEVRFEHSASDGRLRMTADATAAQFRWSIVEKPAGFTTKVALDGRWEKSGPHFGDGQLDLGQQTVPFAIADGSIQASSIDIALESLAPLFPANSSPRGRIRGHYGGNTGQGKITFDDVSFHYDAGGPPLSIAGTALRQNGRWELDLLTLGLEKSRGDLRLREVNGEWQGTFQAAYIDIDEVNRAVSALGKLRKSVEPDSSAGNTAGGLQGQIVISAKQLEWVEAVVEQFQGTLQRKAGSMELSDVSFGHGGGTGTGRAAYTRGAKGMPDFVDAEVRLEKVGANILEGLFLEEARGLVGDLSGTAVLRFPWQEGNTPVLHEISGEIDFGATNGTLGKAGLATKLLTALRTTDILRLRIPHLKDRGLTFNTLSGHIGIESGVFRLAPYAMADSTYILEADATFDFPRDVADGEIQVQVLEGVTGVARRIPLLGEAANLVNKVFGVPLKIVGTASDPAFRVGMPG